MNTVVRRGPVATFFVTLWNVINFTRQFILNVLFFGFLLLCAIFVLVAMAHGGGGVQALQDRTTLVIAPEGRLVEQYSADPATRALQQAFGDTSADETQLRDLLRSLEAARTDKRIERVFLKLDKLQPSGYASMREAAQGVRELRASGKQVVAFGEQLSQSQYVLAAEANEVYVDPMGGGVALEGLARYGQYLRTALADKLLVDVHVFKVGTFKSAVEPFILDAQSDAAKTADLYWMGDVWQRYLGDIAKARKLDPATIAGHIDTMPDGLAAAGGDSALYALNQKLVDGLKTQEEVEALLARRGVADTDADNGVRSISLGAYLAQLDSRRNPIDERPQVAVVVAEGSISEGDQPPGSVGGESTSKLLREARDDENVKAVVLRVDSPGGGVFASEQIRREVAALKLAGKPVVVSMGDVAASGGYWISMNADRIYADPSTITGSIGIFGMFPTIPRTLDKIGVHTDGVSTTRFAGAFDITRDLDPDVGRMIQLSINKGYADFTGKVATARGKTVEQIDEIAQGRVWSGAQAKDRGLVDELGGLREAVADAAGRAKFGAADAYRTRYIEKSGSPFARFITGMSGTSMGKAWLQDSSFAHVMLARTLPQMDSSLRFFEEALDRRDGQKVKAIAYCFCSE